MAKRPIILNDSKSKNMNIEQIIFNIIKSNSQTWVRYFYVEKTNGMTMPGEYVVLRSSFLTHKHLNELFEAGFKIEKIETQKINNEAFCDVLLKREIN